MHLIVHVFPKFTLNSDENSLHTHFCSVFLLPLNGDQIRNLGGQHSFNIDEELRSCEESTFGVALLLDFVPLREF